MIAEAVQAITLILQWPTFFFLLVGVILGLVFGVLPGLGGITALVLLLPITFGMKPANAFVLFAGAMGGTAFGGSVSAILINTPGSALNAATCLDGYPMTRQGRSRMALGVSATASAFGAIFGLLVFIALIPSARSIVLAFSFQEFFWLAILGLTMIGIITGDAIKYGLATGGFGILVSFIGYENVTGSIRFTLGIDYLWDGVTLVPVFLGIFAIGEILNLTSEGGTIVQNEAYSQDVEDGLDSAQGESVWNGFRYTIQRWSLVIRCAGIGTIIGMIPGVGGSVANFVAYSYSVQASDDPDSFGTGNPDGVLASEASNDAKDGGSLVPLVTFGIPGSAITAVLLGGFVIHGLQPGESLLVENLDILLTLAFGLIIANILTSAIGLATANQLAKITQIDIHLIAPTVLVACFVSAYIVRNQIGDVVIALLFGFIGLWMITYGFSRVAFILGLILGPIAERNFSLTVQAHGYNLAAFFNRPLSLVIIFITIASLGIYIYRDRQGRTLANTLKGSSDE